jgi:hypothetical protein
MNIKNQTSKKHSENSSVITLIIERSAEPLRGLNQGETVKLQVQVKGAT